VPVGSLRKSLPGLATVLVEDSWFRRTRKGARLPTLLIYRDRLGANRRSGGFFQKRVAHRPFVQFAACRATDAYLMLTDAQKRGDLGFNAAVDWPSARGANED
jgi:hypothetical protein